MNVDLIIKLIGLNFCLTYCSLKICNIPVKHNYKNLFIYFFSLILSLIQFIIQQKYSLLLGYLVIYILYGIIFNKYSKIKFGYSFIVTIISISLSYIAMMVSTIVIFTAFILLVNYNYQNIINIIAIPVLNFILLFLLFKIPRFKNGFPFILKKEKDDYIDMFIIILNIIIIFLYFFVGHFKSYSPFIVSIVFIIASVFAFIIIQKTFILYQKQKLQTQALKDYESELAETKQQLQTALEEKEKLIKTNHEFYHRQEALKSKLNTIITSSFSTEAANEYSNILDRIDNLSQEYSAKLAIAPKLQTTNIEEIDDMLLYFQSECVKNNIEFIFRLDCNIDKIISEHIDKCDLETLLGDLLRNAIIAINNSSNTYKSIMLVFGLKDSCYQIGVYDSGIEFKIETLLKLGLEKASTYIGTGGTGIGMLTTFETLNKTNASLIITEFKDTDSSYTKLLSVKFDKQNNYCIKSPRAEIIEKSNKINRNIIVSVPN